MHVSKYPGILNTKDSGKIIINTGEDTNHGGS
jgi:hypothetical protein